MLLDWYFQSYRILNNIAFRLLDCIYARIKKGYYAYYFRSSRKLSVFCFRMFTIIQLHKNRRGKSYKGLATTVGVYGNPSLRLSSRHNNLRSVSLALPMKPRFSCILRTKYGITYLFESNAYIIDRKCKRYSMGPYGTYLNTLCPFWSTKKLKWSPIPYSWANCTLLFLGSIFNSRRRPIWFIIKINSDLMKIN